MTAPNREKSRSARTTPYHWFQGESVAELVRQLQEAGPDAILKVHQSRRKMTFEVVHSGDVSTQSHTSFHINDSHLCPPTCPGGG